MNSLTASHALPTLLALLADARTTDILAVGGQAIYADRGAGLELVFGGEAQSGKTEEPHLLEWTLGALRQIGKSWDARSPYVDAVLPSGHRLHALFPPVCPQGLQLSLRRLSHPQSQGKKRWGADPRYAAIAEAFADGQTVLVSGSTGSGKTTFLADLLSHTPSTERIIALEDTPELHPDHAHFVSLISRPANADGYGEVTLRALFKQALRMRPDRIILGECRGGEVLELLQALNTGHRGSIATVHANSPRDALKRVELLCLLSAGTALSTSVLRELLAGSIHWLVHLEQTKSSNLRRIASVSQVVGKEGDTILLREMLA